MFWRRIMQFLRDFMFDRPTTRVLGPEVLCELPPPDPALVERNEQERKKALAFLGPRWVLHESRS